MRKIIWVILGGIVMMSATYAGYAGQNAGEKVRFKMHRGMQSPQEKEMGYGCPMTKMMGKMMGGKSIVATRDGGVVVMIGRKLLKYDKNLKLKAEAEIDIDMGEMWHMKKKVRGKRGGCSRGMRMQPPRQEETEE